MINTCGNVLMCGCDFQGIFGNNMNTQVSNLSQLPNTYNIIHMCEYNDKSVFLDNKHLFLDDTHNVLSYTNNKCVKIDNIPPIKKISICHNGTNFVTNNGKACIFKNKTLKFLEFSEDISDTVVTEHGSFFLGESGQI